ncbi:MAG: anti-sigma factor [Opitutaceae bacterium]|jgi:hypothetical protein
MNTSKDRRFTSFAPPAWMPWALAACLAMATIWLAQVYLRQKVHLIALQEEAALERIERQGLENQLAAERILSNRRLADLQDTLKGSDDLSQVKTAHLVPCPGRPARARAIAVWDPNRQEGVLTVEHMPVPDSHQDYQLWLIDPKYPDPVSGGVITVDPQKGDGRLTFHPSRPVADAERFAISCEAKGGRPRLAGPIVMLSK